MEEVLVSVRIKGHCEQEIPNLIEPSKEVWDTY
jgi:hypothetical protein